MTSINHAIRSQAGKLTFSTTRGPFPIYPNSCKCQTLRVVLSLAQNCVQATKACYKSSGVIFIGSLFGYSRRPCDFLWRRGEFSLTIQKPKALVVYIGTDLQRHLLADVLIITTEDKVFGGKKNTCFQNKK